MANIYIYNYNNYYNRQAKAPKDLADYGTPIYTQTDVNFNPNDGVNTSLVVGKNDNAYKGVGDYMVVLEDGVLSRWFILDHNRKRKGQWILSLHRDVIADNYNAVLNSKCFVDRGTVGDNSPLIYNQEPIPVNQIKKSETLLKDNTGCAWICGFLSKNYNGGGIEKLDISSFVPDITVAKLEDWDLNNYVSESASYIVKKTAGFKWYEPTNILSAIGGKSYYAYNNFKSYQVTNNASLKLTFHEMNKLRGYTSSSVLGNMAQQKWAQEYIQAIENNLSNLYFQGDYIDADTYRKINDVSGKIIYDESTATYYSIKVEIFNMNHIEFVEEDKEEYPLLTTLRQIVANGLNTTELYVTANGFGINTASIIFNINLTNIKLTKVSSKGLQVTIPETDKRLHLKDAPYDMFCIPYGDVNIINSSVTGFGKININKDETIAIAQELAKNIGTDNIYDIQLLPYCPLTLFPTTDGLDIKNSDTRRYTLITDENDGVESVILWSTASQGTFNIVTDYIQADNVKMSNQCDVYRLVSPNYNGQFEFNVAKFAVPINTFNVDYTYLPYKSYIHVNPLFTGLYGQDFDDVRGLICQGDFSIAYLSDAWVNYQVANKNYANIFARQIENLEINNKYDRIENIANAAGNALATGIGAGVVTGNVGAGAVAGMASATAGVADVAIAEKRFDEQISYQTDIYNMQLENIRAMPYGIASQTAYSANNKIFPILEFYSCTNDEKTQVAMYIAENGMTLGCIGILVEYINSWSYEDIEGRGFVRATPIELSIEDDSHLAQAIAMELKKGVYFIS